MKAQNVLIVMAKHPTAGQTKTRLIPAYSAQQAAQLYECFLRDTLDLMRQAQGVQRVVAFLPEEEEAYFSQLALGFELIMQEGNDLGARLDNVSTHYLQQGCEKVVMME